LGIRKIRITGGEPLVREGVEEFIARLHALGIEDLSMTTNGHLLAERCDRLIAAGLRRINISLDSLDPGKFERITRTKSFSTVIQSIAMAQKSRLAPAKVNAVLCPRHQRRRGRSLRFFTPAKPASSCALSSSCRLTPTATGREAWFVPASEVHQRIHARWPLQQIPHERSETARKYALPTALPAKSALSLPSPSLSAAIAPASG